MERIEGNRNEFVHREAETTEAGEGLGATLKGSHKSAMLGEAGGSVSNFCTRGNGAKLTVNTNNQSARPIQRWRQQSAGAGAGAGGGGLGSQQGCWAAGKDLAGEGGREWGGGRSSGGRMETGGICCRRTWGAGAEGSRGEKQPDPTLLPAALCPGSAWCWDALWCTGELSNSRPLKACASPRALEVVGPYWRQVLQHN